MQDFDLLEPAKLYEKELKEKHHENVVNLFGELEKKAKVDIESNRATCKKLYKVRNDIENISKKLKGLLTLKVFCILFIVLGSIAAIFGFVANFNALAISLGLVFVALGITLLATIYRKNKKKFSTEIDKLENEAKKLQNDAEAQMASLNNLFDSAMPAMLFHKTCPLIEMDRIFDVKKYAQMREKFGLWDNSDINTSTLDIQSGSILGNPFVVFKDLNMRMVDRTYTGTRVITYTTGFGQNRHTVTETLRASYVAPEPVYSDETYLLYGNEGAKKLSFTRSPSKINSMSEEEIKKYVRKHEKDLDKFAAEQMKKGGKFTPIGNPEFELFFGGLDRDDEVEFRLLFTPLGQKAMMDLLKSKAGYGDDFVFNKIKGLNLIQSNHSQGETLFVNASDFTGFDFELVKEHFIEFNDNYFKALFFDFAPLLSIPLYSQYKTHEYIYKNTVKSNFTPFVHEVISNRYNVSNFAHKLSKTTVLLKTNCVSKGKGVDSVKVSAHSFNKINKIACVPVRAGNGSMYNVDVPWVEYAPVVKDTIMQVGDTETNDEVSFNLASQKDVIYAKGLVSNVGDRLNVDIKKLKSLMKKGLEGEENGK